MKIQMTGISLMIIPVSYTHLDVYKRQVPEGAAGTPPFWSLVSKVNLAAHFKETLQQHRFRRRFEPSAVHSEEIRSVH